MLITSLFLLSLMCNYMPCDKTYGDPAIAEDVTDSSSQIRFTRSGSSRKSRGQGDSNEESYDLVVKTSTGFVEGYPMKTINGRNIYAFEGVPYAEPPVGHLRFRDPLPIRPWEGIKQAKSPGPACLQYHVRKLVRITGSEDCLTLNVYTTGLPSDLKGKLYQTGYPVVVWIHGGGYFHMSGSEFGPSYLLQENALLVTINFRQGVLGFISTGDQECPGNQGLKDQALGLKWISDNIVNFGGDPTKITIMGVSSGAAAAHLHMMSPLSRHLFQGAISSSGTAMNHWAVNSPVRSLRLTRMLAERVGCTTTAGSRVLMDCFRASNPHFLLNEQQRLYDFQTFPPILFGPVVEGSFAGSFLTDTPDNLYLTNQVSPTPWICTQTTEEGEAFALAFKHVGRIPFFKSSFDKFAPFILDYWYIASNSTQVTSRIREAYFGKDGPYPTDDTIRTVSDLISDRYFRVGIHRALTYHSRIAPTYASLFGFRDEKAPAATWDGSFQRYGVGHASDTGYYLNSSFNFPPLSVGTPGYDVSRILINFVYNFANQREPLLTYRTGTARKIWRPTNFHGKDLQFLLIDNENLIMIPEPRQNAIKFWETLGLADTPTSLGNYVPVEQAIYNSPMLESFTRPVASAVPATESSVNRFKSTYIMQNHQSVNENTLRGY